MDSSELVELLYVAYNRDDFEIFGVDKAIQAGYEDLYSVAPDIFEKKIKVLDEQIKMVQLIWQMMQYQKLKLNQKQNN